MSFLKDKTYEGMDWLSQAIEPYHCPLNDVLANIPDELVLDSEFIIKSINGHWNSALSISDTISYLVKKFQLQMDWHDQDYLVRCFKLEASPKIMVYPNRNLVEGEIKLIKTKNLVDDSDVKKMMKRRSNIEVDWKSIDPNSLKDLGSIFFEGDELKEFSDLSKKGKFWKLSGFISTATDEDRFKIRSVKAFGEFMQLISAYLVKNDPAILGKIYKVLMMAKSGQVIYTIGASRG